MSNPLLFLATFIGVILNLAFASIIVQPDWSMAVLLAAVLAHRGNWPYVALGTGIHDFVLHWSLFACLPWILLTPALIAWSDAQIGANLLQRWFAMLLVISSLFFAGWGLMSCLLTLLLCLVLWHIIARFYV